MTNTIQINDSRADVIAPQLNFLCYHHSGVLTYFVVVMKDKNIVSAEARFLKQKFLDKYDPSPTDSTVPSHPRDLLVPNVSWST